MTTRASTVTAVWLAAATFATLAAGAISAPQATAAIKVRTEAGQQLAKYRTVDCKRNRRGFFADHKAVDGWKFRAEILGADFTGFHTYKIRYGQRSLADFSVFRRAGTSYSNHFEPKTDIPRLDVGGAVQFPRGRKVFRIGFEIAYDRVGPNPEWVSVNGQARCQYR